MDIEITFINNSEDMNNSSVVIFQQNVATNFDERAVAWQVIKNTGRGQTHHFTYPLEYTISASNTQMQLPAQNNHLYEVIEENSSSMLVSQADKGENNKGYTLVNNLPNEIVDADVYKDGRLIAKVPLVAPQQKAIIELSSHEIYIASVNLDIQESEFLPKNFVEDKGNYTLLNLEGFKKPVIELTTGKNGESIFTIKEAEAKTASAK